MNTIYNVLRQSEVVASPLVVRSAVNRTRRVQSTNTMYYHFIKLQNQQQPGTSESEVVLGSNSLSARRNIENFYHGNA